MGNNQVYEQNVGTPMGSPISVVLAEIALQHFEDLMFENCRFHILFWKRYVDDILCSLEKDDISKFLLYINSINNNIKFELEIEENRNLNFLDIKIMKREEGLLSFGIFRKRTHTGKYLDFKSNNPETHKRAVALTLFNRSKIICDSTTEKEKEDLFIKSQLKKNNYPTSFIKDCYNKINSDIYKTKEKDNFKYIKVPYIKGTTERINRLLKPFKISLASKPSNKLSNSLQKLKDKVSDNEKSSVIYKINCNNCECSYIGETGRQLHTRLTEHKNNIKTLYINSQLVQHMIQHDHTLNFDSVSILGTHKNTKSRKILEACHTNATHNTLNRAIEIPQT